MRYLIILMLLSSCGASNGTNGVNGSPGQNGAQGPAGAITTLNAQTCTGTGVLSSATLTISFQQEVYSNGDSFTLCSVSDGAHQYSNSLLNSNSCNVVYAVSGNGGQYFTVTSQSAVYTDNVTGHNGYTVNLTCN